MNEGPRLLVDTLAATSAEDTLHPDCEPYASGRLALSTRHAMQCEM